MILDTAKTTLLAPFDLETAKLQQVFGTLAARKVDYADLYFQYARSEGWSLEEGIVKSGSWIEPKVDRVTTAAQTTQPVSP